MVKAPKLFWCDLGLVRSGTGQWGLLTGEQFETLVVAEVHKWVQTMGREVSLSFYRTRSGLEVDLLAERHDGFVAFEIKNRARVDARDARSMRLVADAAGERWRGGLVVYTGSRIEQLDEARDIWAVPVHRLV